MPRGVNSIVFVVCSLIGYLWAHYLLKGNWATYTSILLSYHLFLVWLLITAEHKAGFSMPVVPTALTHFACLMLLVGIAASARHIPYFGLIRLFVPALAPFEVTWLFNASTSAKPEASKPRMKAAKLRVPPPREDSIRWVDKKKKSWRERRRDREQELAAIDASALREATAEDYEAWLDFVSHRTGATLRRPGCTVKQEYQEFLITRARQRAGYN